jgi:hypothetical protein
MSVRPWSFAPLGLIGLPAFTHGFRRGLHSYAALRLWTHRFVRTVSLNSVSHAHAGGRAPSRHRLRSRAQLPCPLYGLPVTLRDFAFGEMELRGQFPGGLPLAGLLGQHEFIERAQTAGAAEQPCLALLIDGNLSSTWNMAISRMTSIIESIPIRNRSESPCGIFGETSSQKRARTMAESTRSMVSPCQHRAWRPAGSNDGCRVLPKSPTHARPTEFLWRIRMRPSSNSATDGSTTTPSL